MLDKAVSKPEHPHASLINLVLCLVILTGMAACQVESQTSPIEASTLPPRSIPTTQSLAFKKTIDATVVPNGISLRTVPRVWNFISTDFDNGSMADWGQVGRSNLSLVSGGGHNNSTGLSVSINRREAYLYKTNILKTREGYVSFWFNPNQVNIPDDPNLPIPGKSIRIVDFKGFQHYDVIAGLRIWKPAIPSDTYLAYLEWQAQDGQHFDLEGGQFSLSDGWQKITLGFRIDDWVAVWVNDVLVRQVTGIHQSESLGGIVELGKANDDNSMTPAGALRFDELTYQIPKYDDLWVDAGNGSDQNSGVNRSEAFASIQTAASLAGPGTQVHILPGVYRESVKPAADGNPSEPVVYYAEAGPGTVIIRGSEPSSHLEWQQLTANAKGLRAGVDPTRIFYADLSAWKLTEAPRFVLQLDKPGNVAARLPLAREPDWQVTTDWKYAEFWWTATGGFESADCDPVKDSSHNCDSKSRSLKQLTDDSNDAEPLGVEAGNLSTLGDLSGATLVALDSKEGTYFYRRTIVSHNVPAGRITLDRICEFDDGSGEPGLGWGTKYYVEGKLSLLDTPGEWWYDSGSGYLFLWPPGDTNPADLNLEISRQQTGFDLSQRSNIILDGLTFEFFNGSVLQGDNTAFQKSANNIVRNVKLRYANQGLYLSQQVGENPENITSNFTLEKSEIAYMDTDGIQVTYTWKNESAPDSFSVAGVTGLLIRDNELHHLGFRSDQDNSVGVAFNYADRLRFTGNHVHHVAHNGVQFSWSVIQSNKKYGFSPDEIKTGGILVSDNIIEQACQLTADCGALKFWGDPPNGHVYRDVLITRNIFRNTIGWSAVSEKRAGWMGKAGSDVRGMGGFGLFLDMVSGIHAYRNIAYNNAFAGVAVGGVWRDGDVIFYNNILANSLYGFFFSGLESETHKNVNTQALNNILVNNEANGIWFTASAPYLGVVNIDYNLYFDNGWRLSASDAGVMTVRRAQDSYQIYKSVADIQSLTGWEMHGIQGNPGFREYNPDVHQLQVSTMPDFRISQGSNNLVDLGTGSLPDSLTRLLAMYQVHDSLIGTAYDIGPFELGDAQSLLPVQH